MPDPKPSTMTCKCGNEFARAYEVEDVFIGAQVGSLIVDTLHGHCVQCGRRIHISVSSKEAIKLFSRYTNVSPLTVEIGE